MRAFVCSALLLVPLVASAEPWSVGTTIQPVRLTDQHDVPAEAGVSTRLLLVSHDMDGGALVREALDRFDQATLDAHGVAYVADVSRMPGFVTSLVAIPRMRKRPYRILVDRDGTATRDVPAAAGKATLVRLEALRVTAIEQLETTAAVADAIGAR
jgi:hypothetical protein